MQNNRTLIGWVTVYCLLAAVVVIVTRSPQQQRQSGQQPHQQSTQQAEVATLSRVIDGDTVVIHIPPTNEIHVRLIGIDAPERGQAFYAEGRAYLGTVLSGAAITVASNGVDRYGRTLATLYIGETNVCLQMIQSGLAWHFKKYSDDPVLSLAEHDAKKRRVGIWQQTNPVPPWEYRNKRTSANAR